MPIFKLILAACLLFCIPETTSSQDARTGKDWPQWRGPNRDGHSPDSNLLKKWPESGPEVIWQVDSVGVGYSSPAIVNGRIYTQGDLGGIEHIICLDARTGNLIWAVQPEPVAQQLAEKLVKEIKSLDQNQNGLIEEAEALRKFGFDFNQFDQPVPGKLAEIATERAARLLMALDANQDGELTIQEAGRPFHSELAKIDQADKKVDVGQLARQRCSSWLAEFDKDKDQIISRDEAKQTLLDRKFNQIDQRDEQTRKGDLKLNRSEIIEYLEKKERGKDGILSASELSDYYLQRYPGGDGQLSAEEVKGFYGGYRNGQGDGPRGTPTVDGDNLYIEGGNGDVTCLDIQTGETKWHVNLMKDFGGGRPGWGYSESPLVEGNRLIVTPGGKQGTLLALNKNTGEKIWQTTEIQEGAHYSSPVAANIQGIRTLIQFARGSVFGVAAEDGKFLWKYSGANNGTANCATPIVDQNHVFVASAYGTGGGLAKISKEGEQQKADEVYFETKMGNHHGGIVKVGDYLYGFGSGLICMNFKTGKIAWQDRSVGKGAVCYADGMLYLLSERHEIALAEATPEGYREQGRFKIENHGRPSWAHPIVIDGVMYIRNQQSLTAYRVKN
ncbi:PQQ-binding-like beta-propeller repeat protein [Pirellulaceae bacterium]|nr:PQQ-binding-like beta-propeller repeat protein [Pirellulaceae bacterium]